MLRRSHPNPRGDASAKRILLISYYFPPIGGPHSVRWVHLVTSLVQAGFQLEVLTVNPAGGYTSLDHSLVHDLPASVTMHRVYPGPLHGLRYNSPATSYLGHAAEAFRGQWHQTLLRGLKRYGVHVANALFMPDIMVEWVPWALLRGRSVLTQKPFDLILSSAYPVCDHIVGYFLKRQTRLPWICHYSDPWLFYADRKVSRLRYRLEEYLETTLLRAADHLLVPTEEAKAGFVDAFSFLSPQAISLVPAGADMRRYAAARPEHRNPARFRLVYTGTFYDRIREPHAFYAALRQVEDLDLDVICAGNILAHHRDPTPGSRITYLDYQSWDDCIALQKSADVLLFFGNKSTTQLPSKLFEYFAAARPILSVEPVPHTRASQLIDSYQRGMCVPNESAEIAFAIRQLHATWRTGQLNRAFSISSVLPFSWEESGNACVQAVRATLAREREAQ